MTLSPTTITLHALNIVIGIFSIAILILVAKSVRLTDSISDDIPSDAQGRGRSMLFWPGCGGIVDMLLFGFLWIKLPTQHTKKHRIFLNALVFVACFILGRPLIVLIYTFVEHGQADKADIRSNAKSYSIETWSCAFANNKESKSAEALCTELRAARYLLIPTVVLGGIMLPLAIWTRHKMVKETVTLSREDPE